jgi:hypothetical protein
MDKGEYEHTIKLKNQNGKTFYEKLTFIYFEMPNFNKTEEELETRLDQWLYFIKHLEDFQVIPNIIADEVFQRAFEKAELAKLDPKEMEEYERSLKVFRDLNGAFTTAHDDGKVEGIIEGKTLEQAQKSVDTQTKFNLALERAKEIFTDVIAFIT